VAFVRLAVIMGLVAAVAREPAAAAAQEGCITCHSDPALAQSNRKLTLIFQLWVTSPHGTHGVKCTQCHGGDPAAGEKEPAHASMDLPRAKMTFASLLKRCGSCHEAQRAAYTASEHYRALEVKGQRARLPTCITCHSEMRLALLSAKRVRATCAECHNAKSKNSPEVPEQAERLLAGFEAIKARERAEHKGAEGHVPDLIREWHTFDLELLGGDIARFAQVSD
jgi:cytochrome c553